jgi:tetrahydromethanopterin S-methyltransferase subunit G
MTADGGGWNFSTLKALIDERESRNIERFAAMKTAVDAALESSERAVAKAEISTEKRFDAVNEFRATLADQSATLMPRAEYDVQHRSLIARLDATDKRIEEMQLQVSNWAANDVGKKQGLGVGGSAVMGIIAGLAALIALVSFAFNLHVMK